MGYTLVLGDRAYSSWSLRGWLLMEAFGIDRKEVLIGFDGAPVRDQLSELGCAPARTVPCLMTPEGVPLGDSLAIAEELATRHPEAGIWPRDAKARAVARALVAEMHAGFQTLRDLCPMNLRVAYAQHPQADKLQEDLTRLEEIWAWARDACGGDGPWLCGDYSAVDAFYAPVAARIAGYGLPVGPNAQAYVKAHLAHLPFRRWRAMGLLRGADLPHYARSWPQQAWPGPDPIAAQAVEDGTSENAKCPYSGKPVTHLGQFDGRIFGFCNAFCRDKTVADPAAWPDFMALLSPGA